MDWTYITGPLIGAVIGYFTNLIAVKMLFRPLRPLKIRGHIVPFSQGIIPKSKDRLAKAVGNAVGNNLITSEAVEETLLSDGIKDKLRTSVYEMIEKNIENETPVKDVITKYIGEERFETQIEKSQGYLTTKINSKVIDLNAGEMIADIVIKAIKEKVQNGILAMMMTDNVLEPIKEKIKKSIDKYIVDNGETVIKNMVEHETDELLNKPVAKLAGGIDKAKESIGDTIIKIYENTVRNKLPSMLESINISGIVQKRIEDMDVLEMEKLVLTVMKNELNAIVNLGALIGLVLGLVNLLFK